MLLLMGPFVDLEHPEVKDGSLDRTFEQVFRDEVRYARGWQDTLTAVGYHLLRLG